MIPKLALQLLRERVAQRDEGVLADASFALTALVEALPDFLKKKAAPDETKPADGETKSAPPETGQAPNDTDTKAAPDETNPANPDATETDPGQGDSAAVATSVADPMLPEGRRAALIGLQTRVEAATTTVHDPDVIAALLDALTIYLNEELREEPEGDSPTMVDDSANPAPEGDPMDDDTEEAAPESGVPAEPAPADEQPKRFMQCEACGHSMETMPMLAADPAPPPPAAADAAADPVEPDADDEEEPTKRSVARESAAAPKETPMTEPAPVATASADATPPAQASSPAPGTSELHPMTEADRAELAQLRARERERQALTKARTAIREANSFMKPSELIAFAESQWPTILNMAASPPRSYGTGARPVGPLNDNPTHMRESAVDTFNRAFGARG